MKNDSPFIKLPFILSLLRGLLRRIRIVKVLLVNYKRIEIGEDVVFGPSANVKIPDKGIVGNRVAIGVNFICQTNMEIGDDCLLSSNVSFIGNDHHIDESTSMFFSGRANASKIILLGNNFIGFNATLLGDIKVGRGAIIGACALVIKDVPDNAVVAGVPARIIRYRNNNA